MPRQHLEARAARAVDAPETVAGRLAVTPEERLSVTAEVYDRFRPVYPAALFDWMAATTGVPAGARVLGFRFTCQGTVHQVLSGRLRVFPQAVASPRTPSWNQIYAWLREMQSLRRPAFGPFPRVRRRSGVRPNSSLRNATGRGVDRIACATVIRCLRLSTS